MEAKLNTVAEEEISALMTAKAELTDIFEKSTQEMTEEAMAQFSNFDLAKFDLAQFDLSKFDMKNFDFSKFMPSVEAAKPVTKTTRKVAAPKATA
jgi:GH25 family lysozyme M1 (1,4-beta-N-acetylmuramidase)